MLYEGNGLPPNVPFTQPKNLFRYGEITIWSTQLLVASEVIANSSFRLFSVPLSSSGQGFQNSLTIGETSQKEAGRVPSGLAFDIYGVSALVGKGTGDNDAASGFALNLPINTDALVQELLNIQQNAVLSWDFTQSIVDIAPLHLIGAGGGVFGSVATSTGTGTAGDLASGHMNNGAANIFLYRRHPVSLPGGTTFSILLRFGSRAANVGAKASFVKVALFGFYKNVIEIGQNTATLLLKVMFWGKVS